jgi:hypothetical protein
VYATCCGTDGDTELLGALGGLVPFIPVAVTVNVYAVPLVNPVTTSGEEEPVAVKPPGLDVTVYPVTPAGYPVNTGAVNATDA